jgi:hypothetical protein
LPQPGSGCQTNDPLFLDPLNLNFNLQMNSPCRNSGLYSYDLGAKFYDDILAAPDSLSVEPDSSLNSVTLEWSNPEYTINGNSIDTLNSVHLWRNGEQIALLYSTMGNSRMTYIDQVPRPDYYRYQLCAEDTTGKLGRQLYTNEMWIGGQISGIVIWELDPTPITGSVFSTELVALGYSDYIYTSATAVRYPLENTIDAVFICLGIYPNNHVLSEDEGVLLRNYLYRGGCIYLEGGDTWCYDPQTIVHPYFQIVPIGDGTDDLIRVEGQTGTPFENYNFTYSGENSFIDDIDQTALSTKILKNSVDNLGTTVVCLGDGYKTIGSSFEFGGLIDDTPPSTKRELLRDYLEFFGIIVTGVLAEEKALAVPAVYQLYQNYPNPFNPGTTIEFELPQASKVTLKIFNILGEEVAILVSERLSAGSYSYDWSRPAGIASGVYLYRLQTGDHVEIKKMVLMK